MFFYIKNVTFDCADALALAPFWAAALGTDVDEDSTSDKAFVEAAGWGGPNMWFNRVPEGKPDEPRTGFVFPVAARPLVPRRGLAPWPRRSPPDRATKFLRAADT